MGLVREDDPSWMDASAPVARRCLLLVEDDRRLIRALARVLEFDGYEVLAACDARNAQARARERGRAIGVIVTDVWLPDATVAELVSDLAETCTGAPILFMSGAPSEQSMIPTLGVRTHFLAKPFSPQELKAALRSLCDG